MIVRTTKNPVPIIAIFKSKNLFSKTKKTGARIESNTLFWDSFSPRTSLFISDTGLSHMKNGPKHIRKIK